MRKTILYGLLVMLLLPACSHKTSNNTVSVAKPKYHHRLFSRKKDKRVKRVKMVRMKN